MKIIITESQAKKLKLIGENIGSHDIIATYENSSKQVSSKIDKMFLSVMSMSVGEIVNKEFDLNGLYDELSKAESMFSDEYRKITDRLEVELSEDEFWDIEGRLYAANNLISDKVSALKSIIDSLLALQNNVIDDNILKHFEGVKPLDITDNQNF